MPTFTSGHILAPSDNAPVNDTVLINLGTGLIDGTSATVVKCEFGAWIPAKSSFALVVQAADHHLYIYDFTLTLQHSVDLGLGVLGVGPVSSDYVDTYYVGQNHAPGARVATCTVEGVLGGTVFVLAVTNINGICVNPTGTILYYAEDAGAGSRILTWDLVGNAAGPVFNPGVAGAQWGPSALCLPSGSRKGDILFGSGPIAAPSSTVVYRYNPAGVLQQTYTLPSNIGGLDAHLSIDPGNVESFWVRTFPTLDLNTTVFTQFSMSGSILASNTQHTTADPTTIATSCPMFAWSAGCAPPVPKRPGCQGFGGM